MNISQERVNQLVAETYAVALGQSTWQDYCNSVDEALGGGACIAIHGQDMKVNLNLGIIYTGFDPAYIKTYGSHYSGLNPYVSSFFNAPAGAKLTTEDMVDIPSLKKSEFYSDWLRPQEDVWPGCGVVLFHDETRVLVFGGQLRAKDTDQKFSAMMSLLDVLTPHLMQAFEAQRRLALSQAAEVQQSMDASRDGLMVLDTRGRVCQLSRGAAKFLDQQGVMRIGLGSVLIIADDRARSAMSRALRSRIEPSSFFVRSESGKPAALLTVTPIQRPRAASFTQPFSDAPGSHLVTIAAPANELRDGVRSLVGLTQAEVSIAEAILQGFSLQEIADSKGRSVNTVRNQLRSIMEKTGTRRQAELVSVLAMLRG